MFYVIVSPEGRLFIGAVVGTFGPVPLTLMGGHLSLRTSR